MEPTRVEFLYLDPLQKGLFYALMALGVALMLAQFARRAQLWRRGKPIGWRPDPWPNLARYALGQRKVLSGRLRSGAPLHLLLFVGFGSLFVATSLLAVASYAPLLGLTNFHRGNYYLLYEAVFDVLGLALLAGCVWGLVRRWRLARAPRPPMPTGPPDWLALALLLALGLTGYAVEAARIAADPKPWDHWSVVGHWLAGFLPEVSAGQYVALWWVHSLLVFAFLVTLPQLRLKHLVTGSLTIAGNPPHPMGALQPVSMAEFERTGEIGLARPELATRWHLLSLDACMSCGRCTEVCPAWGAGKVLDPKGVVSGLLGALEAGEPVVPRVSEEALWQCTTCNACVEACPVLIRHVDLIVDARRALVADGKLSGPPATLLRQIGATGHVWGARGGREDWMRGLPVPLARDGAPFDWLLWVGCAGAFDPEAVRATRALAELLLRAGVSFACLGEEEACTGDPARRIGDEFTFQGQTEINGETFRRYGVRRVLTPCPHCFNTLQNEYRQFGLELEVRHHSVFLAELIAQGRLKAPSPASGKLTYHDPCYLARANGVVDAPRAALGDPTELEHDTNEALASLERPLGPPRRLSEPEHHGRKTLCCGAGGGRMWMDEAPDQRPADRRLLELRQTGAERVAVACPFCRIMLGAARREEDPRLADIAEIVREANP